MRAPGFEGASAQNPDNSVQWLAKRIVADRRFAEATVKFWWPAIMGSEVAEPPEDAGDADFDGRLLAANAQAAEVERLARGFRQGFQQGHPAYNLKDLLVEVVLSPWFRADAVTDGDPIRNVALRGAGANRLLTPEELTNKTAAVTGYRWGGRISRDSRRDIYPSRHRYGGELADKYELLYGGIDSDGITERARDLTAVMAGIAKRHAVQVSCAIVIREFYLWPEANRRLFAGIGRGMAPASDATAIRDKLVDLHDRLLGVRTTSNSPDVETTYRLFVDVSRRKQESERRWFPWWTCDFNDRSYFDGIVDTPLVEKVNEWGHTYYGWGDHVWDFMDGIDFSDPHSTAQAWAVVLAYLLMDYRYLYL